jgi:hypothetical protein
MILARKPCGGISEKTGVLLHFSVNLKDLIYRLLREFQKHLLSWKGSWKGTVNQLHANWSEVGLVS